MVFFRAPLATLLFLALSSVADAATMSPSFEASLIERLAARKAAIAATPSLKYQTYLPEDVNLWRLMSVKYLSPFVRSYQDEVDALASLAQQKPADAGAIRQFMNDARDFVVFFDDGVRSGDIMDATRAPLPPPPTTRPTPPPTPPSTTSPTTSPPPLFRTQPRAPTTSSDGSSSHDDDSDTVGLPAQRPATPLPYTQDVPNPSNPTPSPRYVSPFADSSDMRLSTPVIVLLFIAGMLTVFLSILKLFFGGEELRSSQEVEDAAFAAALQADECALHDAKALSLAIAVSANDRNAD